VKLDIPVPDDLAELMAAPKCLDLSLPPPKTMKITLPSGGKIQALHDLGKSIPTDCSLSFSLMLQIMPLLASMECVVKILKLLKPLSDIISNLPTPPSPGLLKDFGEAVADLAECFVAITPAGMIPFIRDILILIIALLNCLVGQLKTLVDLMSGLMIDLAAAEGAGNTDLAETIKCAQENSNAALEHLLNGFGPVGTVLELMGPFMAIAGISAIQMPQLGSDSDIESLQKTLATLQDLINTLQQIVDGLPE
jgi:hypothetical protein